MASHPNPDEDVFGEFILDIIRKHIPNEFVITNATKTVQTKIDSESSWEINLVIRRLTLKEKLQADREKAMLKSLGEI